MTSLGNSFNEGTKKLFSIADYEKKAREILGQGSFAWSYLQYGNERSRCLQDCVNAFSRYRVRCRALQDISDLTLGTTILGEEIPFPIGVAPTGYHNFSHPDGEIATAKGTNSAGTVYIQGIVSNHTIAEVATADPGGLRWVQIYPFKDRRFTEHIVRECEKSGIKAIVVTVDSPCTGLTGKIEEDFEKSYNINKNRKYCLKNFDAECLSSSRLKARDDINNYNLMRDTQYHGSATWKDIEWIKSITSLPIVCKGILTAESALDAADAGVDGIVVSTHGGRQSDGAPATIDALAEVVDAVRGRGIEVYLDGGIRTGNDVLKALGRGARAVFIGRPAVWGLACEGAEGVTNVLEILKRELEIAMAVAGCRSPQEIPPGTIVHESYYHYKPSVSKL